MARRSRTNKKVRLIAVGAALATGGAIIALLPSANAADDKTPEEIMQMCDQSRVINGEQQSLDSSFSDSFLSDSCEFVETKFEALNGPTEKVTVDFPNCEPNATGPATVTTEWSTAVAQGQGKYSVTQQGGGGGLFGFLSGSWVKHTGTLDMTIKSATASDSEERQVPVGKVLHVEFTPKLQRMTGVWRVKIDAREATTTTNATPEQIFEAEDVVEGPVVLAGAAGAPGVADGVSKPVLTDC
ncbi:hypothetical protein ADK57_01905 [Streptomyces sp. MMG1533]|uniref:hypothetical protein n=1 Tax=Streptomyces sp. MMG1533 TaxID=1415546 RepID=UPI0006C2FC18|nr:hypothetical protein [Streptomyces sp. MMG1533]KOU77639.1 hypothetical protein ADK57_01905 [Streptomyces sp. MMG1533]